MRTKHAFLGGFGILTALSAFMLSSCQKGINSGGTIPATKSALSVYMTDGPNAFFDKVLVDIQGIAVKIDTSSASSNVNAGEDFRSHMRHEGDNVQYQDQEDQHAVWDILNITPGEYNLLNFANGADTMLSAGNMPKGRIIAFRLTLGTDNLLVKDSINYPLNLWPGTQNVYIRIFGDEFDEWAANHYRFWIDFDAGRSIIRLDDGKFYLRTILRAFTIANTGAIEGRVLPISAYPIVSVFSGIDSLYALPNLSGEFRVMGLADTTYGVFFNASAGYQDTTIDNVAITNGNTVHLGTITLHQ